MARTHWVYRTEAIPSRSIRTPQRRCPSGEIPSCVGCYPTNQVINNTSAGLQPVFVGGVVYSQGYVNPASFSGGSGVAYTSFAFRSVPMDASSPASIPDATFGLNEDQAPQTYWETLASWISSGIDTAMDTAVWIVDQISYGVSEVGGFVIRNFEAVLDGIQLTLDVAGFIPVFGAIPDIINSGIHLGRGSYLEAGLSAGAAVPFAGDAAQAVALVRKVVSKGADFAASAGKSIMRLFGKSDEAGTAASKIMKCIEEGKCFVAGTLVSVAAASPSSREDRQSLARHGIFEATTDNHHDLQTAVGLTETPATHLIPIETVSLGARIPTKNPRPEEYAFEWPEPDESSWVLLTMEWRKTDGGIVDAELLRPRDWVASSHLEIGSIFKVYSTELELNGIAEVTAISPCPPLSTGDGEVVTGRFVTRRADETVRMTFETGDTLEGSKSHPIWSPAIQDWVPMEDWTAGDAVLGREGWITVTSVEARNESVPLYNIEVRGEHVYVVTQAGILVHNSNPCSVNPGIPHGPHEIPPNSLTLQEVEEIQAISKEYSTTIDVVGSRAAGKGRNIQTDLPVGKPSRKRPKTRSDIDFRFDTAHPNAIQIMKRLRNVGNGGGRASLNFSNNPTAPNGRITMPPYIRFTSNGRVTWFD